MKSQAVEITTFKLSGYTFDEFIEANKADIDGWLKKQKGFHSRMIIETEDKKVMDMVFWNNASLGTEAMHRLIKETSNSQVHLMIDHRTVSWNMYQVGHLI
jgi:hypothetical protein